MRGLPSALVTVVVGAAALAVAGERHSPRVRPYTSPNHQRQQPIELDAIPPAARICPGTVGLYDVTLVNNTGATSSFDISYSGFSWNVSGETIVGPLADGESAVFRAIHRPPDSASIGEIDTVTVTAQDQSGPDAASIEFTTSIVLRSVTSGPHGPDPRMDGAIITRGGNKIFAIGGYGDDNPPGTPAVLPGIPSLVNVSREATVNSYHPSSGTWTTLASDWNSIGFSGDMAVGRNVSGEAVAVAFPDATGLSDLLLHVFSLDYPYRDWARGPLPAGFPPGGVWAHDISCDRVANICYITGGATVPGGGDLTTVLAYDVAASTITQLPPFTSPRAHHASFLIDSLLCIAGGIDATDTALASTQCYDLVAGSWNSEDADLGPLPGTLWGMADAVMEIEGALRPAMAAGIFNDGPPGVHFLWHDGNTWQVDDPFEVGVYRTEADAIDDEFFLVGGSASGLTPTTTLQTLRWCSTEPPPYGDCTGAIDVPYGDCVTVTNVLAGDSGPPLPSCGDYQGGDVWLRVTIPDDAIIPMVTLRPDVERDIGMSYYAECPHEIELQCKSRLDGIDDIIPAPGTYWFRAWENGNDDFHDFTICALETWIPVELTSFSVE